MDSPINNLTRYTKPTPKDQVPYCTRWTYQDENDSIEIYIQISRDETTPQWRRLGDIFEAVFFKACDDLEFLQSVLEMYSHNIQVEIESPLLKKDLN